MYRLGSLLRGALSDLDPGFLGMCIHVFPSVLVVILLANPVGVKYPVIDQKLANYLGENPLLDCQIPSVVARVCKISGREQKYAMVSEYKESSTTWWKY